jgi:hypothetical protein
MYTSAYLKISQILLNIIIIRLVNLHSYLIATTITTLVKIAKKLIIINLRKGLAIPAVLSLVLV